MTKGKKKLFTTLKTQQNGPLKNEKSRESRNFNWFKLRDL